jgi:phosphotransferase system  glucose/maltose/N-acetylglucosamine-specific IIC component
MAQAALPLLLSNPQFAQAAPQVATAIAPQAGKTARTLFIVLGIIIAIFIILVFVALISKKKKKSSGKGKGGTSTK